MGCLWVIKINRVFLTDLLSSSELRLGLPSVRQANTRAAAECSPVCALPARAPVPEVVGGLEGAGGEVSVCGHSPMTFTGRTPNGGLPRARGRRRRIRRALPTLVWGPWHSPLCITFVDPQALMGSPFPSWHPPAVTPRPVPVPGMALGRSHFVSRQHKLHKLQDPHSATQQVGTQWPHSGPCLGSGSHRPALTHRPLQAEQPDWAGLAQGAGSRKSPEAETGFR